MLYDILCILIHTASKVHEAGSVSLKWLWIWPKLNQPVSYIYRILPPASRDRDCIILQYFLTKCSELYRPLLYILTSFTPCSNPWKQM